MSRKLGLVTVLFNSSGVLPGFFESLYKQTDCEYVLYIIDNSLDDLSYTTAVELINLYDLKNVKLIKNEDNVGVAAGNNQGIFLALEDGCDYVLLLNNDIEFENEFLFSKMLSLAEERKEKIIVPKIYFFDSRKIWYAGGKLNKWIMTTPHLGEGDTDNGQFDIAKYTEYAPTCFMLIHNSVFNSVGMMDERYFVYYDDTDFVIRAANNGIRIWYWPDEIVLHKVSSSTGGAQSTFAVFYSNRNRLYFIKKNLSFVYKVSSFVFIAAVSSFKLCTYKRSLRKALIEGIKAGINH